MLNECIALFSSVEPAECASIGKHEPTYHYLFCVESNYKKQHSVVPRRRAVRGAHISSDGYGLGEFVFSGVLGGLVRLAFNLHLIYCLMSSNKFLSYGR